MKKLLVIFIALFAGVAWAQQTPNLNLNIPAFGTSNWNTLLNANFTLLDSKLACFGTSTVAGTLVYYNGAAWVCLPGNASGLKVLQEDGSGNPSWVVASGGTGSPGGNDGNLQFNNAGTFGGFPDGTSTQVLHGGRTFSAVNLSTDVTNILAVVNGGTGTTTPSLVAGTNISITGTWPNQTVTSTGSVATTFDSISSGTNTTAAMLVGSGATLGVTGTGTIAATTAIALASNPTDCAANQFATTIDASGNLTCAALNLTSAQFANQGTTTTVLHGNGAGNPTFGAVSLINDVTGNLAVSHLNSGTSATSSTFWRGDGTWAVPAGVVSSVFTLTGAIPNLSGDVTTANTAVTTLATVNSNVGSFTSANITVDAKGRITAAANGAGGNVSNSGTPTSGQIPVWQSATTQSGVTNVTFPGDGYFQGRPVVDIRSKGAVGNGSTDDAAAINSAIALAANLGTISALPYSAILYLPCGNYAISAPLVLPRSTSNSNSNGIVEVRGEGQGCVWISPTAGFPTARGVWEWDQTNGTASHRTLRQEMSGFTIKYPAGVDKVMGIYYQYTATNTPITTANAVAERAEHWNLHDIEFQGNNHDQQYHIYIQGDCFGCTAARLWTNDARATGGAVNNVYESVLLNTDTCATASAPWQETCGWQWSSLDELGQSGNRGGYSPIFQGRLNQSTFSNSFVNGARGGFANSQGFSCTNCYSAILKNIGNEGLGDAPQFLFTSSTQMQLDGIYPGAADNQGFGIGDAIDFVASSQNIISHVNGKQLASQALQSQQWVASTTITAPGTGYTGTPTATASGGTCTDLPTYTVNLSGSAIGSLTITNPGNCTGTPTIAIAGTGSGATATNTMTGAGTLYWVKLDSNSHQNNFIDLHSTGAVANLNFSDLATNQAQWCDQTSSACASYFKLGIIPGANAWTACNGKGLGDGLNAIPAATYLQFACVNDTGAPVTITGIKCYTDNAGSSTLNVANNAGTSYLTGAITCNNTKTGGGAAGTQSATVTIPANDAANFTFVADGTSKQANWTVSGAY